MRTCEVPTVVGNIKNNHYFRITGKGLVKKTLSGNYQFDGDFPNERTLPDNTQCFAFHPDALKLRGDK
jgi:hypothetical protein